MPDNIIEKMSDFFNTRADTYDRHMIEELDLNTFYNEIASCLPCNKGHLKVLDLGCGTGLELERLFLNKLLDIEVVGIDISEKMLDLLRKKFIDRDKQIILRCGSYLEMDFGESIFDVALSTYSMHHFNTVSKQGLYNKIYRSLKSGGIYIEGDYVVKTVEEEREYAVNRDSASGEKNISDGYYHFDIPLAVQTQMDLFYKTGFSEVVIRRQWDKTCIFICKKLM